MLATILTFGGFGLIIAGGILQFRAHAHLKPEFQNRANLAGFSRTSRYTNEGQRIIRQTWRIQLTGIALFLVGFVLQ